MSQRWWCVGCPNGGGVGCPNGGGVVVLDAPVVVLDAPTVACYYSTHTKRVTRKIIIILQTEE